MPATHLVFSSFVSLLSSPVLYRQLLENLCYCRLSNFPTQKIFFTGTYSKAMVDMVMCFESCIILKYSIDFIYELGSICMRTCTLILITIIPEYHVTTIEIKQYMLCTVMYSIPAIISWCFSDVCNYDSEDLWIMIIGACGDIPIVSVFEGGRTTYRIFPIISRPFLHRKSFEKVGVDIYSGLDLQSGIYTKIAEKTTTRMKIAMRQMTLGRQTACMCVSLDSSHENCSYHIHKYSCKFNGIQRPFLFYMNLQVVLGGGLIFGKIW